MKSLIPALLIGFFILSINVSAQKSLTLTLDDAVNYALQYNKTLVNSKLGVDKANAAVYAALANGLPQIDATMDYTNAMGANISIRFNENLPASEIPIKPTSNLKLQVSQLIFNGAYIVGVQTARLYKEISQTSLNKSEADIKAQVTQSYYMILISEELFKRLQHNLSNLTDLYEKNNALVKAGIIEQTDADQLFIQVNSLQSAVNAAERQVELSSNMLRLQLGTDINTELLLTDNLEKILDETKVENSLLTDFKVKDNFDYKLVDQQVELSRKLVDMKKAAALPSIVSFYSYTHKLLKPEFDMSPANLVGLQLNLPIFSSGLRSAQTRQAFIDLKMSQNTREIISDQLQIQEKQLRFNLINAMETYNNQKSNIEVSSRVYNSLKLKYEQGLISGLELITADSNYLRAETEYINAAMQLLIARNELQRMYSIAN